MNNIARRAIVATTATVCALNAYHLPALADPFAAKEKDRPFFLPLPGTMDQDGELIHWLIQDAVRRYTKSVANARKNTSEASVITALDDLEKNLDLADESSIKKKMDTLVTAVNTRLSAVPKPSSEEAALKKIKTDLAILSDVFLPVTYLEYDAGKPDGGDFVNQLVKLTSKQKVRVAVRNPNSLKSAYGFKFEQQKIDNGITAATETLKKLTGFFAAAPVSGFANVPTTAIQRMAVGNVPDPTDAEAKKLKEIADKVVDFLKEKYKLSDFDTSIDNLTKEINKTDDFELKLVNGFGGSLLKAVRAADTNREIRDSTSELLRLKEGMPPILKYEKILRKDGAGNLTGLNISSKVDKPIEDLNTAVTEVQKAVSTSLSTLFTTLEYNRELRAKVVELAKPRILTEKEIEDVLGFLPEWLQTEANLRQKLTSTLQLANTFAQRRLANLSALRKSYSELESGVSDLLDPNKFPDFVLSDTVHLAKTDADILRVTVTVKKAEKFELPTAAPLPVPDFTSPPDSTGPPASSNTNIADALKIIDKLATKPAEKKEEDKEKKTGDEEKPVERTITLDVYGRLVPDFSVGGYVSDLRQRDYIGRPIGGTGSGFIADFDKSRERFNGAAAFFHFYQTRPGLTPTLTIGGDFLKFRTFLTGASLMVPFDRRRTRMFLTGGLVFGKVRELNGVKIGETTSSATPPTRETFKQGFALGISFIFNFK